MGSLGGPGVWVGWKRGMRVAPLGNGRVSCVVSSEWTVYVNDARILMREQIVDFHDHVLTLSRCLYFIEPSTSPTSYS